MKCIFVDWPDKETFEYHVANFIPFHAVQTCFTRYPTAEDLATLSCQVNVCSTEVIHGNVFYGDVVRQEHLPMMLSTFVEGFLALESKRSHWIHGIDLQLYLSQATLYSCDTTANPIQIRIPGSEIEKPLPLLRSGCCVSQINLWMNISPVCTGLHYDQYDNIIVLLRGCKTVSLVSPLHTNSTRPVYLLSGGGANHSMASSAAQLTAAGSLYPQDVQSYVLNPGDAIFIPEGWWHDVASDECSLALNFWFASPLHDVINGLALSRSVNPNVSSCAEHMTSYVVRASIQKLISNDMLYIHDSHRSATLLTRCNLDSMDSELFELFMFDLHGRCTLAPFANTPYQNDVSEDSDSTSAPNRQLNEKNLMEDSLVTCSHESMRRLWPTYAERNPVIWGEILLQLRPISAFMLTTSWEKFNTKSLCTDVGEDESVSDFFSVIFDPLKEQAAQVSEYLGRNLLLGTFNLTRYLTFHIDSSPLDNAV